MATLKEIADKAKVSITTVSRTLNFDKTLSISDKKKKMIFEIAEELEYKTPRRKKAEQKPKLNIALLYWYTLHQELEDPYYLSIRRGIERSCEKNNINIIRVPKQGYEFVFDTFSNIDGIVAVGKFGVSEIDSFKNYTSNIVFVDYSSFPQKFDSIVIDFRKAMDTVLSYIVKEKGYREVGYLGGREYVHNQNLVIGERREQFFIEYMKSEKIYKPEYIKIGNFTSHSGYELMKELLKQRSVPKAVFAASDSVAIGAIKAINESGLAIPKDIAIVGFNDIPNALYTFPPLTTIKVPTEFMGEKAVDLLLERIAGRDIRIKVSVDTELIERESI